MGRDASEQRIAELQRVVYGRPDGHLGPEAQELAELMAHRGSTGAASMAASTAVIEGGRPTADVPDAAVPQESARPSIGRRSRRWLVGTSVAIAVVAAAYLLPALQDLGGSGNPIDLLETPRPAGELVPTGISSGISASSRLMDRSLGYQFWLAREGSGALCLVARREYWAGAITVCTDEAGFRVDGLAVGLRELALLESQRPEGIPIGGGVVFRLDPSATEVTWSLATSDQLADVADRQPAWRTDRVRVVPAA